MRVGCMGEVMLELVPGAGDTATLGVAGDTYNTAVYLAHLIGPDRVDYVTVLGTDAFSARIRARMRSFDVDDSRCLTHPDRIPGLYAIETDAAGERSFTYWRSTSAARTLYDPDRTPDLSGLTHLYYSGITLAILSPDNRARLFDAVAGFRATGGVVAFDSNYRPALWENVDTARMATEQAWRSCDIALPSLDDEMALFGDPDEAAVRTRLTSYAIPTGALKRGAAGPCTLGGEGDAQTQQVHVRDSTAAGDSFNAGFLAAHISGKDTASAMNNGHTLAARVVQHPGAIII
ncbi:MAG: sugar kinase [Pseudomonadota bacterium]